MDIICVISEGFFFVGIESLKCLHCVF